MRKARRIETPKSSSRSTVPKKSTESVLKGKDAGKRKVESKTSTTPSAKTLKTSKVSPKAQKSTEKQASPLSKATRPKDVLKALEEDLKNYETVEKVVGGKKKTVRDQQTVKIRRDIEKLKQEQVQQRLEKKEARKKNLRKYKMPTIVIPPYLRKAITQTTRSLPRSNLKTTATQLSDMLRKRTTTQRPPPPDKNPKKTYMKEDTVEVKEDNVEKRITVNSEKDVIVYTKARALAYVAHRVPGVYSCTLRVFTEVSERIPDFSPKTMLDFGSGPGTAIFSAREVWKDINNVLAIDPSSAMMEASEEMLKDIEGLTVQRRRFLFTTQDSPLFDLVSASYVLSELKSEGERLTAAKQLWNNVAPGGVLVIVEPGTPITFQIVKSVRRMLLTSHEEGTPLLIAPCPHSFGCPMSGTQWCHFSQRVERIPVQLGAKASANINWEDEKFSYVIFQKGKKDSPLPTETMSRLVRHPIKKGGHVIMDMCTPLGKLQRVITSKAMGKEIYTAARKSSWGDLWFHPTKPTDSTQKNSSRSAGKFSAERNSNISVGDMQVEAAEFDEDDVD